jgi:hypothetical protein
MSDAYCPAASPSNTYLFEHVRAIGAEGIVSKRAGSHIGGASRDWRQTNCPPAVIRSYLCNKQLK